MLTVIIIAIIAGGYIVSTRLHPLTGCPRCNSSGRHMGALYKNAHRRCRRCAGSGRKDRVGTKVFWGGTNNTGVFPKK